MLQSYEDLIEVLPPADDILLDDFDSTVEALAGDDVDADALREFLSEGVEEAAFQVALTGRPENVIAQFLCIVYAAGQAIARANS